jgi:hypothetical protein
MTVLIQPLVHKNSRCSVQIELFTWENNNPNIDKDFQLAYDKDSLFSKLSFTVLYDWIYLKMDFD